MEKYVNGGARKERPFISVMILCYNYGFLLGRALNACAEQTFRDFEIVMVNNGSTDETEEVYKDFCATHPEVQTSYVHISPNQGIGHGWNAGLENAHGEYVMLHDADDWMDPNCLEQMANEAEKTGADRVVVQYREVGPGGKILRVRPFPHPGKSGQPSMPTGMLQGVIFKRSVIENNAIAMPEGGMLGAQDWWFNWTFLQFEGKNALIRETLYNYYYNPKSVLVYKLRKSSCEDYYNRFAESNIMILGELLKTENYTPDQYTELTYQYIKLYYTCVLTAFQRYLYKDSKVFYNKLHRVMANYLPDYLRHPWLWPLGNGYEFSISLVIFIMSKLEKMHAIWLMKLAGLASRFKINLR